MRIFFSYRLKSFPDLFWNTPRILNVGIFTATSVNSTFVHLCWKFSCIYSTVQGHPIYLVTTYTFSCFLLLANKTIPLLHKNNFRKIWIFQYLILSTLSFSSFFSLLLICAIIYKFIVRSNIDMVLSVGTFMLNHA